MLTNQVIEQNIIDSACNPVTCWLDSTTWGLFISTDNPTGKTLGLCVLDNNSASTLRATIYEQGDEISSFTKNISIDIDLVAQTEDKVLHDPFDVLAREGGKYSIDDTFSCTAMVGDAIIVIPSDVQLGNLSTGEVKEFYEALEIKNQTSTAKVIDDIIFPSDIKARWSDSSDAFSNTLTGRTTNQFVAGDETNVLDDPYGEDGQVLGNSAKLGNYMYTTCINPIGKALISGNLIKTNVNNPNNTLTVSFGITNHKAFTYIIDNKILVLYRDRMQMNRPINGILYDEDLNELDSTHFIDGGYRIGELGVGEEKAFKNVTDNIVSGIVINTTGDDRILSISCDGNSITYQVNSEIGSYSNYDRLVVLFENETHVRYALYGYEYQPAQSRTVIFARPFMLNKSTLDMQFFTESTFNVTDQIPFGWYLDSHVYSCQTGDDVAHIVFRTNNGGEYPHIERANYEMELTMSDPTLIITSIGDVAGSDIGITSGNGLIYTDKSYMLVYADTNYYTISFTWNETENKFICNNDPALVDVASMDYSGVAIFNDSGTVAWMHTEKISEVTHKSVYFVKWAGGASLSIDLKLTALSGKQIHMINYTYT